VIRARQLAQAVRVCQARKAQPAVKRRLQRDVRQARADDVAGAAESAAMLRIRGAAAAWRHAALRNAMLPLVIFRLIFAYCHVVPTGFR